MAYSSPATVSDGNVAPATWGNSVKAATDYLANPPAARVYKATTQSINSGAVTTLNFDTERFDTAALHDNVTNNNRLTLPATGLYIVGAFASWGADTDYSRQAVGLRLNGGTVIVQTDVPNPTGLAVACSALWKFTAADYVDAFGFQVNTSSGANTVAAELWAVWVGLG